MLPTNCEMKNQIAVIASERNSIITGPAVFELLLKAKPRVGSNSASFFLVFVGDDLYDSQAGLVFFRVRAPMRTFQRYTIQYWWKTFRALIVREWLMASTWSWPQ